MNKVTQEQINYLLDNSETEEHVCFGKMLIVVYKLPCTFCLVGVGSCVDPNNFNLEIGRKVAREQAEDQLWKLEGYNLQLELNKLTGTRVD
jgi:hypothetical protein